MKVMYFAQDFFFFIIYTVQTDIWQVIHYLQDWQANHLVMPQKFEFTFNTEPKYVFYFFKNDYKPVS